MKVIEIDPRICSRWKYADRSSFEFGDSNIFAEDIKRNGQITPIAVRPLVNNDKFQYEVIAGSRRLQACLAANIPIRAIVYNVSDQGAVAIQIKENEKSTISDYSKGVSYAKLKQDGKLTQEQLAEIVGCSKRKIQKLLAFEKIDQDIWHAVHNMSIVSAKSAETILAISQKSLQHKEALIEIAEEIRKGAGNAKIEKLVNEILVGGEQGEQEELIQNADGQVLAKWKAGKLHFAKDLNLNKKKFNKMLINFFTTQN